MTKSKLVKFLVKGAQLAHKQGLANVNSRKKTIQLITEGETIVSAEYEKHNFTNTEALKEFRQGVANFLKQLSTNKLKDDTALLLYIVAAIRRRKNKPKSLEILNSFVANLLKPCPRCHQKMAEECATFLVALWVKQHWVIKPVAKGRVIGREIHPLGRLSNFPHALVENISRHAQRVVEPEIDEDDRRQKEQQGLY